MSEVSHIDIDPASVKRILVCQLRQIGDVLLATPSLHLLKQRFPQADIHVYTEKKCVPMLENNPDVSHIWALDRKKLNSLAKELVFYWNVARGGYDIVIDFQQLPRCRWVVALSQAKVRLSYTPEWYNRWMFTHWVTMQDGYSGMAKASVLRPLGIEWKGQKPALHFTDTEMRFADDFLQRNGLAAGEKLVTIDATHRRATRRWPAGHYGALISRMAAAHPDWKFLLLFGPGEEDDVRNVRNATDCPEKVMLPEDIISLREMAACIRKAVLHVGNCSAPRHIAVAVGTPTYIILGATSPAWTFPSEEHTQINSGLECQPCNDNTCDRGYQCLEQLTADKVWPDVAAHIDRLGL